MSHTNWPFFCWQVTQHHMQFTAIQETHCKYNYVWLLCHCTCLAYLQCPCMCPCASVGACMYVCIRDFMHVCVCVCVYSILPVGWGLSVGLVLLCLAQMPLPCNRAWRGLCSLGGGTQRSPLAQLRV